MNIQKGTCNRLILLYQFQYCKFTDYYFKQYAEDNIDYHSHRIIKSISILKIFACLLNYKQSQQLHR